MTNRTTEKLLKNVEWVRELKEVLQEALNEANKSGGYPDASCCLDFAEALEMAALIVELSARLRLLDVDNSELKFDLEVERNTNIINEAEIKELAAKLSKAWNLFNLTKGKKL